MAYDYTHTMPLVGPGRRRFQGLHVDSWLLLTLGLIVLFGGVVLNSAAREDSTILVNQGLRIGIATALMLVAAQVKPHFYLRWAPTLYIVSVLLAVFVLVAGAAAKGSQRWLDLPGLPRFQPSELMKLTVPLAIAWFLRDRPSPPSARDVLVALALLALPAALIVAQPDLGTGLLVAAGGIAVILLSGVRWWMIGGGVTIAALAMPLLWSLMHDYQRARVLTLLNPQQDPSGAGWNIIQSMTALGSGGLFGKGLFNGTQSRLEFLPESHTDFIIAVIGEELGLIGVVSLLGLYLVVIARTLYIAIQAPNKFSRLTAGGLALVFFAYVFVNIAMAAGLLPVVGVPLPLVSYGGTSVITLLLGFGIVMSIRTHQG